MKKLILITLALSMTLGLVACGEEVAAPTEISTATETGGVGETVSMVDVNSEQGISLKLPSDLTLQENKSYINMKTGDSAVFAAADIAGTTLSAWTEQTILATYQSKYKDVVVKSFENGKQINGKEALEAKVELTTPKGNVVTLVLVMVTDGSKNYVINFTYGTENKDSSLAKNLQACIDSITIADKAEGKTTVTITGSYDAPQSINAEGTVVLGDESSKEYLEIVIQGKIQDFEIVNLEFDSDKNELIEKDITKQIERLENTTVVLKTVLAETIPTEKIKWKSVSGKEYEYIVKDYSLEDENAVKQLINLD